MIDVPELDPNLNRPPVKVLVLVHAHLARAADLLKVVAKRVVDAPHELVEPRLPLASDPRNLFLERPDTSFLVLVVGPLLLDLGRPAFVLSERIYIVGRDERQLGFLGQDLAFDALLCECVRPLGVLDLFVLVRRKICNRLKARRGRCLLHRRLLDKLLNIVLLNVETLLDFDVLLFEVRNIGLGLKQQQLGLEHRVVCGANGAYLGMVLQHRLGLVETGVALFAAEIFAPSPGRHHLFFLGLQFRLLRPYDNVSNQAVVGTGNRPSYLSCQGEPAICCTPSAAPPFAFGFGSDS